MRTEQEMYDLVINTAKEDERIRVVYMNGSKFDENPIEIRMCLWYSISDTNRNLGALQ